MKLILACIITFILMVPATASAADVHIDAQDRSGSATFNKNADGSVKATVNGTATTYTAAEAKTFADLVKPDQAAPACSNWADDDGDGFKDFQDAGCTSATDNDESNVIQPPPPPPPSTTGSSVGFMRGNWGNGGTGFATSAGRDKYIVLQGFWRCAEIDEINRTNPGVKLLIYKNLTRYQAPYSGSYCGTTGAWNSCLTTAEATSGGGYNWTSSVADTDAGGNIVTPVAGSASAYASWCVNRLKKAASDSAANGHPIDGIYLDDVNSSHDGNTSQGASQWDSWAEAVNREVGAGLKAAGLISMANVDGTPGEWNTKNGGWSERQIPFFDAYMGQYTTLWPGCGAVSASYVSEAFRLMKVADNAGVDYVAGDGGASTCAESGHAFTLGLGLIQAPNRFVKLTGDGNTETWFASYDRAKALGQPTAAAVQTSTGVWERQFQNGKVTVNLNTRTATIP